MTPGPTANPTEINHPTLGPSVAIYDDRRAAKRHLAMCAVMVAGGIVGLLVGGNDLRTAEGATGILLVVAGIALCLYGLTEIRATLQRLETSIRLVVGNGGFEDTSIPGSVDWDEVETIGFEKVGRGMPGAVKVQLLSPREFAVGHGLSRQARIQLRMNNGAIYLARGALTPTGEVLDLMNERLAEHRRDQRPGPAITRRGKRRTSRP